VGRSLNPLSSVKMMVRFSRKVFFKLRPAVSLPAPDGFLVTLARPPGRWQLHLSRRSYLRRVVPHTVLLLDELAHPRQGPQPGQVSELLGSLF
jgi:hypothetical protein